MKRLGVYAELFDMDFGLVGVFPDQITEILAAGDVDVDLHGRDLHDALEHVQFRSHAHELFVRGVRHQFAGELCIPDTGGIAHAGEQAAGPFDTQGIDQLLAQRPHGADMQHDHPLVRQQDLPLIEGELQMRGEIELGAEINLNRHGRSSSRVRQGYRKGLIKWIKPKVTIWLEIDQKIKYSKKHSHSLKYCT